MAQTTLPVRLLQRSERTTRHSAAFRVVVLTLFLVAGSIVTGCGSGGDGADAGADRVPSGQASASLAWDPVGGVMGYYIHYGTQSPNNPGSCSYDQSTFSPTPTATVNGLAEDTTYFFAVSAFNGLESACSAEVSTVTRSA
jgi:hypothetical protein